MLFFELQSRPFFKHLLLFSHIIAILRSFSFQFNKLVLCFSSSRCSLVLDFQDMYDHGTPKDFNARGVT